MATSTPVTPAQALLDILDPAPGTTPTDAMAEEAMTDFLTEITALDRKQNRNKRLTQDQLAEQVFGHSRVFKNESALGPYCRYHLRVALEQLSDLDKEMRSRNNGAITMAEITRLRHIIRNYVFDLRDIVLFLQRNVPGYVFFHGGKNAEVNSWEVYILAEGLAYQSAYSGQGPPFNHKTAQIASIFVLRQAMELRFQRLIAVYPTDPKGKPPKLRHGFHQDFIVANPQFFRAEGSGLTSCDTSMTGAARSSMRLTSPMHGRSRSHSVAVANCSTLD